MKSAGAVEAWLRDTRTTFTSLLFPAGIPVHQMNTGNTNKRDF